MKKIYFSVYSIHHESECNAVLVLCLCCAYGTTVNKADFDFDMHNKLYASCYVPSKVQGNSGTNTIQPRKTSLGARKA